MIQKDETTINLLIINILPHAAAIGIKLWLIQ